ncbi:MAG: hypothetical protein WCF85_18590 [Rhodospirillaceae bacterium]
MKACKSAANSRLEMLIAASVTTAAGKGFDPGGVVLIENSKGDQYRILVCPLRDCESEISLGVPAALIFISDNLRNWSPSESKLSNAFRITQAEAKFLKALIDGRDVANYAQDAGISYHTARSHLKSIFNKTGESCQSGLIRMIISDPMLLML